MKISFDPAKYTRSHGYPRPFLLSKFSITVPIEQRSLGDRLFFTGKSWLAPARAIAAGAMRAQVFTERHSCSYSALQELPLTRHTRHVYLDVLWQNHIMVDQVADELRSELTFKEPPEGRNAELLREIDQCVNPVSLHVRRGDCMIAATNRSVLPIEYYSKAVSIIGKRVADPTLFVFSDDIPYVKAALPRRIRTVFVEHNDDFSAHEDLRLMASCRHHIIANSSFSWWGAWLNAKPDKIVIAPRQWYRARDSYYPDLLPKSWVLLDILSDENMLSAETSQENPVDLEAEAVA